MFVYFKSIFIIESKVFLSLIKAIEAFFYKWKDTFLLSIKYKNCFKK